MRRLCKLATLSAIPFETVTSPRMRSILIFCLLLLAPVFSQPADAQCRMRVMDARELTLGSDVIARVRVREVKKIRHPVYSQLATLELTEVIFGDPRQKELKVWAGSNIYCATDKYEPQQEMLVFLVRDQTLFRTNNWQYGQFAISADLVEGWRSVSQTGTAVSGPKSVEEVRKEIFGYFEANHGKTQP